jgi:Spy/CpxP family protein refolding chaperone
LLSSEEAIQNPAAEPNDPDSLRVRLTAQEAAIDEGIQREIALYNRIEALEQMLNATRSDRAPPVSAGSSEAAVGPPSPNDSEGQDREERWEARRQERIARDASDLTRRLNLTPTQTEGIEAALAAREAARREWFEARRRGEDPGIDPEAVFRDELAQVLTPQQLAEYDSYEEAVAMARIETGATARMNNIAPRLDLNEAQKDAVYAAYYQEMVARRGSEPATRAQAQVQLEAEMQRILTPEQFAEWQNESQSGGRGRGFP